VIQKRIPILHPHTRTTIWKMFIQNIKSGLVAGLLCLKVHPVWLHQETVWEVISNWWDYCKCTIMEYPVIHSTLVKLFISAFYHASKWTDTLVTIITLIFTSQRSNSIFPFLNDSSSMPFLIQIKSQSCKNQYDKWIVLRGKDTHQRKDSQKENKTQYNWF